MRLVMLGWIAPAGAARRLRVTGRDPERGHISRRRIGRSLQAPEHLRFLILEWELDR